jgi:hypothetical protein
MPSSKLPPALKVFLKPRHLSFLSFNLVLLLDKDMELNTCNQAAVLGK